MQSFRERGLAAGIALLVNIPVSAPTEAEAQVDRLQDLRPAIIDCWSPPPTLDRLEVTVRFSLNIRGEIIGRPAITYAKLGDDEGTNREFIASVLTAIARCTPVELSSSFGEAFAGRPVAIRFLWDKQRKSLVPRAASF